MDFGFQREDGKKQISFWVRILMKSAWKASWSSGANGSRVVSDGDSIVTRNVV